MESGRAAEMRERQAPRLVGHMFAFAAHLLVYGLVCALLGVVAGQLPTVIVALSWGIGVALHGFFGVAAPLLRAPLERQAARALTAQDTPRPAAQPELRARALEALSAAIAHEIRNPITAAKSLVQQIAEDPGSSDNVEYATVAVAELDRVERSIVHLLRFAREEALELGDVDVAALVGGAVDTVRDRAQKGGIELRIAAGEALSLRGDAEKLRRLLINLLANAIEAGAAELSQVHVVEVAWGTNLAGGEVWIAVRDDGPGFADGAAAQVFQPFHTSKPGGTGLGLALARKTAEAHRGTLEATNRRAGGAELLLVLPIDPAPEGRS